MNRFEREPRENDIPLLELHRREFMSRSLAILGEHKQTVRDSGGVRFHQGNASLNLMGKDGAFSDARMSKRWFSPDRKSIYTERIFITFSADYENTPVKLTRLKRGVGDGKLIPDSDQSSFQVSVPYGPLDLLGEVALSDPKIAADYPVRGVTVYSSSDKTTDWRSGIPLVISENASADALLVREDYGSEAFAFPMSLNIYNKLQEIGKQLEMGK
jgi:hypothetical protein